MTHADPALAAGRIPVVGGFVGATTSGVTTTLGRGGSDFSAAIVGACLGASEIQIWTDVDGMLTADPRIVSDPQVVPHLSFAEASELAYFGAKVLHPATIQPAVARNIPVRILNSHRAHALGTLDHRRETRERTPAHRRGLEAGSDRRRHHLHADADGARLPPPALRGVRAIQDAGGRRHDLRSQRLGDGGRCEAAAGDRDRAPGVCRGLVRRPHGDRVRGWRRLAARPDAGGSGAILASATCRCGWCLRRRLGETSRSSFGSRTCHWRWGGSTRSSSRRWSSHDADFAVGTWADGAAGGSPGVLIRRADRRCD